VPDPLGVVGLRDRRLAQGEAEVLGLRADGQEGGGEIRAIGDHAEIMDEGEAGRDGGGGEGVGPGGVHPGAQGLEAVDHRGRGGGERESEPSGTDQRRAGGRELKMFAHGRSSGVFLVAEYTDTVRRLGRKGPSAGKFRSERVPSAGRGWGRKFRGPEGGGRGRGEAVSALFA
jgi:hypothetical protein